MVQMNGMPFPDVMAYKFHCEECGFTVGPLHYCGVGSVSMTTQCACGTTIEIIPSPGPTMSP